MSAKSDLSPIKQIPIIEVAKRLGIQVRGTRAMCFMGHDKVSPSLSFLKSRNAWRCFGACGKHGDGIKLVMEKEGLDFKGVFEWFARVFAVDVTRHNRGHAKQRRTPQPKKLVLPTAPAPEQQEFFPDPEMYEWLIVKCGKVSSRTGLDYLRAHGISDEAATRFNIQELRDSVRAFRELLERWGAPRVFRGGLAWGSNGRPEQLIWASYALLFPCYKEGKVVCIQARNFIDAMNSRNFGSRRPRLARSCARTTQT